MKGLFHMAKLASILMISIIGWKVTGYDFFIVASLLSFAIDIYSELHKLPKKYHKYTKNKTAKW